MVNDTSVTLRRLVSAPNLGIYAVYVDKFTTVLSSRVSRVGRVSRVSRVRVTAYCYR